MPLPRHGLLASVTELLGRVRPRRFEEPEATLAGVLTGAAAGAGQYQRLRHQTGQVVDDLVWFKPVTGTDGLGCLQCPAAAEHGEPAEQDPFALAEQVVAPVDQRSQRSVARQRRPTAPGQEAVSIAQSS